ncbi:hypothetical protein, partial [Acetobacter estunensis]
KTQKLPAKHINQGFFDPSMFNYFDTETLESISALVDLSWYDSNAGTFARDFLKSLRLWDEATVCLSRITKLDDSNRKHAGIVFSAYATGRWNADRYERLISPLTEREND